MHGWVDIGGWGRCTQAPCLFVHLLVCAVIATGVTPGPMSLCTFVGVWSHCYWCDTRPHVSLYICWCGVIATGVTPGPMSLCTFVGVESLLLV